MTPTPPGVDQASTPPGDTHTQFTGALVPFPTDRLPGLPTPLQVHTQLRHELGIAITKARETRGIVTGKEDTYELIEAIQAFSELMTAYSNAFVEVGKDGKAQIEDELFTAVKEQDGIPTSNMKVPSGGGDISITRKIDNEYTIDLDQVISALAAKVSDEWKAAFVAETTDITPGAQPEQFAIEVAQRAIAFMGSAKPKITQVRALAEAFSRTGDHRLAKVVNDAVTLTRHFKGIDVKRAKPAA